MLGQEIDSGTLHIFIETHGAADETALADDVVFEKDVAGEKQVVFFAPRADPAAEGIDEEMRQGVVVVHAHRRKIFVTHLEKQLRQPVGQLHAAAQFCKGLRQGFRPRHAHAARQEPGPEIRFVGEDSRDRAAEFRTQFSPVSLMGDADEFLHSFFIQHIQIGFAVEPGAVGGDGQPEAQQRFIFGQRFTGAFQAAEGGAAARVQVGRGETAERPAPVLRPGFVPGNALDETAAVFRIAGDEPARRAGGPAVLVVEPGVHAAFFRFVDAGPDALEPLPPEILRVEADARMHEKSAEAHFPEIVDLPPQLLRFEFAVPRPEGSAAKFFAGGRQTGENRVKHFIPVQV